MAQKNHFQINRRLFEHPLWLEEPFTKGQAWVDLIGSANYKDGYFIKKGQRVDVARGQSGTSMLTFAKRWQWSRGKVKRFFVFLEKEQMIAQQTGHLTTLVSICNYDVYQLDTNDAGTTDKTSDGHLTDIERTSDGTHPIRIKKESNKNKKGPNNTLDEKNSTPKRIIELLNKTCDKNFNTQTEAHRKAIKARLSEGHTFEDFKTVIEFKNQDWTKDSVFTHQDGKTKKARGYLQPSTLFSSKNFDKYLNEASSSGFVKSKNLKSREEVEAILKTALKEKTEDATFRVIKELDPEIYTVVRNKCQLFFLNRESGFGVIYTNYTDQK